MNKSGSNCELTSRERVLAALRHEQPDRVPRDFWAEPPTWNRLLAHTGFERKSQLLDWLDVDVRHLAWIFHSQVESGAWV